MFEKQHRHRDTNKNRNRNTIAARKTNKNRNWNTIAAINTNKKEIETQLQHAWVGSAMHGHPPCVQPWTQV